MKKITIVSIPLWFDSYLSVSEQNTATPVSLNSTMVRFIHSVSSCYYDEQKSCLNSTMVRFILFPQPPFRWWEKVSIPLWFDSYICEDLQFHFLLMVSILRGSKGSSLNSTMVRFIPFNARRKRFC